MSVVVHVGKAAASSVDLAVWSTLFASLVALFVGVLPLLWAKSQRARIGRAEARVAASDLTLQALHVAAALHLMKENSVAVYLYRKAASQFSVLDAESCRRVVPYLDCLPKDLEAPLGDVIANIGLGVRNLSRVQDFAGIGAVDPQGTRVFYQSMLTSLEEARGSLSRAVGGGHTLEAVEEQAEVLAKQLSDEAAREYLERQVSK
jgi:hypothetical protein